MGSALLNTTAEQEFAEARSSLGWTDEAGRRRSGPAEGAATAEELRLQVAERLAAHRRRRGDTQGETARENEPARAANTRAARIAAAVAERYAQTPSYREVLAAEAQRAIQQARAAAEVAAMNAQAVAAAQQRLLEAFDEQAKRDAEARAAEARAAEELEAARHAEAAAEVREWDGPQGVDARDERAIELRPVDLRPVELHLWPDLEPAEPAAARVADRAGSARERATLGPKVPRGNRSGEAAPTGFSPAESAAAPTGGGFTVRLYEDAASAAHVDMGRSRHAASPGRANLQMERNDADAQALDEEIAFRQAPVFEESAGPAVALPANLIEFPRQLVASRKARPRYAEGPLRDEAEAASGDGQLRIFEVEPTQICTTPAADVEAEVASEPQWTSIWLDTPAGATESQAAATSPAYEADALIAPMDRGAPLQVAPIARRMLAGAINSAIMLAGVAAFAGTLVAMSGLRFAGHSGGLRQAVSQLAGLVVAQTGLQPAQIAAVGAVAGVVLAVLYQALFFCFSGATPGMRCTRIAFCTFDDGNPTRRAIRRRLVATLASACPLGLGYAWAALDEDHLTWHDRITRMYLRRY